MQTKQVRYRKELYTLPADSSLPEVRRALAHFGLRESLHLLAILSRPDDTRRIVENYRTCTTPEPAED